MSPEAFEQRFADLLDLGAQAFHEQSAGLRNSGSEEHILRSISDALDRWAQLVRDPASKRRPE